MEDDHEITKQEWRRKVRERWREETNYPEQPCLHHGCSECHGTGRKANGQICVHFVSCPCPKCNKHSLTTKKFFTPHVRQLQSI